MGQFPQRNVTIVVAGNAVESRKGQLPDEERLARALTRAGATVFRSSPEEAELVAFLNRIPVDWILFPKLREFRPEALERVKAVRPSVRLAQVVFDLMDYEDRVRRGLSWNRINRLEWWLPFARRMDIVFLREQGHLERYAREGVRSYYLDQACDVDESPFEGRAPKWAQCDIAFLGTYLPQRARILRRLSRGLRLNIYTERPMSWILGGIRAKSAVYGRQLAEAVAGASVIYGENARNDVAGYWSDRVYRVLGHRGFFLTRYVPGLEEFFRNHEHLVWGRDDEELESLARRYLADEPSRRKIAAAGFAHVRARHTYDHRARELLSVLEGIGGS